MTFMGRVIYRMERDEAEARKRALRGSRPGYYTPAEVAAQLSVSEDTVLRQFAGLPGVIDIGTPERMHKRRKRLLRISESALQRYIVSRQG